VAAGPSKMAPSLEGSAIANGDPAAFALVLLKGIAKENQDYLGMMMPLEASLPTDDKLAAIMTYIRNAWGNGAPPISTEAVARYRESFAPRAPWTPEELLRIK